MSGLPHNAVPAAFGDVPPLWFGGYSFAWFIGVGLGLLIYAMLMTIGRRPAGFNEEKPA